MLKLSQCKMGSVSIFSLLLSVAMSLLIVPPVMAQKVGFNQFCDALVGGWHGSSARSGQEPKQVSVTSVCSADKRQLMMFVSRGANHVFSETWWFREHGEDVLLTFYDGVDEDKQQSFTLYKNDESFSLLGRGELQKRPALIQLKFDKQYAGWLWLQNAQFLDDDAERYLFFRGIEMLPDAGVSER